MERPESWKAYLTDLFNEICYKHPGPMSAIFRQRTQWACDGASSYERMKDKSFSQNMIEKLQASKTSAIKKAAKLVNFFLNYKKEKKEEKKKEETNDKDKEGNLNYFDFILF